jgi:hypothetical protein
MKSTSYEAPYYVVFSILLSVIPSGPKYLLGILILPVALGPGVYSASNRNEYQKHKNNVSVE